MAISRKVVADFDINDERLKVLFFFLQTQSGGNSSPHITYAKEQEGRQIEI